MFKKVFLVLQLVWVACSSLAQESSNHTLSVIPTPKAMVAKTGEFRLDNKVNIVVSNRSLLPAAQFLQEVLPQSVQSSVAYTKRKGDISLHIVRSLKTSGSYRLNSSSKEIQIEAADYSGVISAISTLRQLLNVGVGGESICTVPAVAIEDAPRFEWRGLMLDASRHFWKPSEVKRVIDLMALYKLNKFHWHLTDDQGWRIEIKKYPLLTEKGAWRKFNKHDLGCIDLAQKTDNPDYLIPDDKLRIENGDTLYGGYYTQKEIKEIVAYAGQRGIEVIPEIDMPGHFLAAINEYPELTCDGMLGWGQTFSSPICPGKDSSLEFCRNIFKEVFELFPSRYVHLGGDEVEKKNWEKCALCQKRIKDEKLESVERLQAWFVCQMEQFFLSQGKRLIGWDEVVGDGLSSASTIMWWRSWSPNAVPDATKMGMEAICSPNFCMYFDYQQDENSVKKVLEYEPYTDKLTPEQCRLIRGVQANLWTEWVPSMKRVEYMIMPRMLALSEVAWTAPDQKPTIREFYTKLVPEFKRLDEMQVNYRVPDLEGFYRVNAFVDHYDLNIKCALPNAIIRYTTDGSMPTKTSPLYTGQLRLEQTTDLTFRTFRPDGSASDVTKASFVKSDYAPGVMICSPLKRGLNVAWHDFKGTRCEEIDKAPLKGHYQVDQVSIPDGVKGNIGLVLKGFIQIPEDGIYTFVLTSDDGSTMTVDGSLLIDNDGNHSPKELIAQRALKKGSHPVEIRYFDRNGGMLKLEWINSQGQREECSKEWFMCAD